MKNEKMKWYFLIAVALVVGAIIGYFATSNLTTEGNAVKTLSVSAVSADKYRDYAFNEIDNFVINNNLRKTNAMVYRSSTEGELKSSDTLIYIDLKKYDVDFSEDSAIMRVIDKENGQTVNIIKVKVCTGRTVYKGNGHSQNQHWTGKEWFVTYDSEK